MQEDLKNVSPDNSVSQNREIKFRAWNKRKNKMEVVDELNHISSWFKDGLLGVNGVNGTIGIQGGVFDECYIMQYTGLKDKNGVEIYEGDIVIDINKSHSDYNKKRIVGISPTKGTTLNDISVGDRAWTWYEIIGNIYQNPELLSER